MWWESARAPTLYCSLILASFRMLPNPESNFSFDSTCVHPSATALQIPSAVLDTSTEAHLSLPLLPSAKTHLRKFTTCPEDSDVTSKVEVGFEKRNREFAVGRHCARVALNYFDITAEVLVDTDRKPIWPAGIVGSISHSQHYAWAAVAKKNAVSGIGIDTEIVVDDATMRQVLKEITVEAERNLLAKIHSDVRTAFTVVFSAKESIYKCLYPMNEQFFGFHDVELIAASDHTVTFAQHPSNPNYSLAPRTLTVQYAVYQNDVFSTIWV